MRGQRQGYPLAALAAHSKILSKQGLRGGRAQANEDLGLQNLKLCLQPWKARINFFGVGFFMNMLLALGLPFEMLYDVGYVHFFAGDPGLHEGFVEQLSGRPHEGFPCYVLIETWLLPHKDYFGACGARSENRLNAPFPKRASTAMPGRFAQFAERRMLWNQLRSTPRFEPPPLLNFGTPSHR